MHLSCKCCTKVLLEGMCAGIVGLGADGLRFRNIRQGLTSCSRGFPNVSPCGAITGDQSSSLNLQTLVNSMEARLPTVCKSSRGWGLKPSPFRENRLSYTPLISHKAPHLPLVCLTPHTSAAFPIHTTQNTFQVSCCSGRGGIS